MGLNQQASSLNTFSFSHAGIHLGTSEENFDFGFLYALPLKVVNQVTPPSVFDLYIAFEATLGEIIEVCLNVFKQIIINDL